MEQQFKMLKKISFFFYKFLYLINFLTEKLFNRNFLLWFKVFIENDHYKNVNVNTKNIKLFIPNNLVKWRVNTFFDKEPETINWIKNFKLSRFHFWDIGANIGQYSIYCAITHQGSQITSFEPSTNNLRILSRNIAINKLENQISIFPGALSNKPFSFLNLSETSFEEGSAHNNYGKNQSTNSQIGAYRTFGLSINYILEQKILPLPNFIKIDVDGIEKNILEGGLNFLGEKDLLEVSVEINENEKAKCNEIINIFNKSGFAIMQKKHNNSFHTLPGSEKTFNYIFKKII